MGNGTEDENDALRRKPAASVEAAALATRRRSFRDRIRELDQRQHDEHPQAFLEPGDPGSGDNPDVIDERGLNEDAPDEGRRYASTYVWPPVEWHDPARAPGDWRTGDLPSPAQLIHRAVTPYETKLGPGDRAEYLQWLEEHPNAAGAEVDPDRPRFDWAGYWNATQHGAGGADAKRPLSHWETPYSPTFRDNADSKYRLPLNYGIPPPATASEAAVRFARPYNTPLKPDEEREFRQWLSVSKAPFNDTPNSDYDMRGYFRALREGDPRATTAVNPSDGQVHYPDAWKTPHHATFSDESIYTQPGAPSWHGDVLVAPTGHIVADDHKVVPPIPAAPPPSKPTADVTRLPPPPADGR